MAKIKINTSRLSLEREKIPKGRAPHNPTKAHSTKKGKKGYNRRKAKKDLSKV